MKSFWSPEGGAVGGLGGGLSFVVQSRGSGGKTDAILTPPAPFNSVANHPKPAAEKNLVLIKHIHKSDIGHKVLLKKKITAKMVNQRQV